MPVRTTRLERPLALVIWIASLFAQGCGDGATPPLSPAGTITVRASVEGDALEGATVTLTRSDTAGATPIATRSTNAEGTARFEALEQAAYTLEVAAPNTPVDFAQPTLQALVSLTEPVHSIEATGTWRRSGSLAVQVAGGGVPVGGAWVALTGPAEGFGHVEATRETDPGGFATFDALVPGTYSLILSGIDPALYAFADTSTSVSVADGSPTESDFEGERLPQIPHSPGSVSVTLLASNAVEITWQSVSLDETRFEIERSTAGAEPGVGRTPAAADEDWSLLATLDAMQTTWRDDHAPAGSTLTYRVRGCNQLGCSPAATTEALTTPAPPPSTPGSLLAAATGPHSTILAWSDTSDDEDHFRVERARTGEDFVEIARPTADASQWSDQGLSPATRYRYRVRACATQGCSPFSNEASVVTQGLPPTPPTGLQAAASGTDRVDLTWPNQGSGISSLRLERTGGGIGWAEIATLASDAITFIDTGLAESTTYDYRLRRCNDFGCSDPSPQASATTLSSPPPTGGLGPGASLGGWRPFPADNPWNTDISGLPVDPNSATLISACGDRNLHPDFGTEWAGAPIGIPYTVVDASQPNVPISFYYSAESDPGPYPIPPDAPIEGGASSSGDRHVIVIDRDSHTLYEVFDATPINGGTSWTGGSGAVFDMTSNALRPAGWTSADAAGLPIFPGLVRYDEAVENGAILHALRFTCPTTRRAYVAPARHWASSNTSPNLPPMGMRVRLKASFDLSGFPSEVQVILQALKTYGMFLADNGSGWYISGAPDPRWDDSRLGTLKSIPSSAFEVVQMGTIVTGG